MEAKMALACILKRFKFERSADTQVSVLYILKNLLPLMCNANVQLTVEVCILQNGEACVTRPCSCTNPLMTCPRPKPLHTGSFETGGCLHHDTEGWNLCEDCATKVKWKTACAHSAVQYCHVIVYV